jgi:hypothetical protein
VIRPGDRVFFEPGEDRWHGAAPDRFMTHLAMQEADDSGSPVIWGEHVSDEEYEAAATARSHLIRGNELHIHSEPDPFPFAICAPLIDQAVDDPHDK